MSKRKLAGIIVGCVIVIAAIAAPLSPRIVTDYSSLLNYLRHSGASIREGEERLSPNQIPYMRSITVYVNERTLWVWEHENAIMGKGEPSVGVDWVGRPGTVYFYRAGRIAAMYTTGYWETEDDKLIISLLEDALGKPYTVITEEGWREEGTD